MTTCSASPWAFFRSGQGTHQVCGYHQGHFSCFWPLSIWILPLSGESLSLWSRAGLPLWSCQHRYLLTGLPCSRWASLELDSTNQMNLVQTLNWKLVTQKSRSHPESILVWGWLHPAYWHSSGGRFRAVSSTYCQCGRGTCCSVCLAGAALGLHQTSSPAQFAYFPWPSSPRACPFDLSGNSTNQSLLHGSATCVVTQGPRFSMILCLVKWSAAHLPILQSFHQEASHFHLALGPAN